MKSLLKLPLIAFYLLLPSQFLLAQETTDYKTSAGGGSPVQGIIGLLIALLIIVAMWKVFTKAGQPGWASIIQSTISTFGARSSAGRGGGFC